MKDLSRGSYKILLLSNVIKLNYVLVMKIYSRQNPGNRIPNIFSSFSRVRDVL
jgi:hypothetical protein